MSKNKTPFLLENDIDYRQWREHKLAHYPTRLEQILVDIKDPFNLSSSEITLLQTIYHQTNFALYRTSKWDDNQQIPLHLGKAFGLKDLDLNWLGESNGLTKISVSDDTTKQAYIPYTTRPIKWHTDGYYNSPQQQISGMTLHCVDAAQDGGINGLLDPEILYIHLRDKDPAFINALMQSDAMTIPPRLNEQGEVEREIYQGAVFSISNNGNLHMRYSQRTHNIEWKNTPDLQDALSYINQFFSSGTPYIFHYQLQSGMGILTNNVLHDRSSFTQDPNQPRLLYRGRYLNRLK